MTPIDAGRRSREALWLGAIFLLILIVFAADVTISAGYAEWVFYLVPVGLTVFQRRPSAAVAVTGTITLLMIVAYFVEPGGVATYQAEVRRGLALLSTWIVGAIAVSALADKATARRLIWVEQGRSEVTAAILGDQTVGDVGRNLVRSLAEYSGAAVAAGYRLDEGRLVPAGAYALDGERAAREYAAGEGIAGQVVSSGKPMRVSGMDPGALQVRSASVRGRVSHVLAGPLVEDGRIVGVVELGYLGPVDELRPREELLRAIAGDAGVALRSAIYRQQLHDLLAQTQAQSAELQAQQEELRVSNEELEEQARVLRESQSRLENQQAELEQTNVQLEEQTQLLERQKREMLSAQQALAENALTLERTNRYKSEFLANMSHELRTPLNSSLILAKLLADNTAGNLDADQVRYARTIHSSNNDLLTLINDILDLSKIEAGQVEVNPEPVSMDEVIEPLRATFEPIAADRKVAFHVDKMAGAPASLTTDLQRLHQILKNLLSNAFKFTSKGQVELRIAPLAEGMLSFSVSDSGIGIAPEQQEVIFEAFRQADSGTSRQYAGTGLGLSISRELARLLGGSIHLKSAVGMGSTFTLEIPVALQKRPQGAPRQRPTPQGQPAEAAQAAQPVHPAPRPPVAQQPAVAPARPVEGPHIDDDRNNRHRRDRLILVVEDDQHFARVLYDLAHELAFDCVHCSTASEAIDLAKRLKPSGILLDVSLPDASGLSVLERIKRDPAVRHIPVHMVSVDDHSQAALGLGAVGYALKPVAREELVKAVERLESRLQKRVSRVLVVEDDETLRRNIVLLLQSDSVEIVAVGTVAEAMARVQAEKFDCLVTDLALPDASGYDLLEKLANAGTHGLLPVIVYTGRALSREEETHLRRFSKSIIIKGARSPERLLDEVTLFLHRVEATLPPEKQNILRRARQRDELFEGRRILLAEDDVRNIFALSRILEPLGAQVDIARNGQEAVDRVAQDDIDLVLMDIMMPVKDGLEAMREIRAQPQHASLPIIAITAKAMADDRRQCLEAGANDYIPKPIDVDKLVSLCRVWLSR